jgi:UDP-N-acetyl-2-amino-2-deoxyglucuronate dehydrogenase
MQAIKDTGNELVAAVDPHDSVGIIDSYFPDAHYFTEFERFDRHVDKLRRKGSKLDYISICSPNYLHDAHIRFALRNGAHAICEKPLILNPWNLDALQEIEAEYEGRIYNILQLRLHPAISCLKKKNELVDIKKKYEIDLSYITSRGRWYPISWKGNQSKSGGIAANIGIHFFDMLCWIFGGVEENVVHVSDSSRAAGYLELKRARVRWFLSVAHNDLPEDVKQRRQRTFRSITVNGEEIEFSGGFTELHTEVYRDILAGGGYGLDDARTSIEVAFSIRNSKPQGLVGDYHPYCRQINP